MTNAVPATWHQAAASSSPSTLHQLINPSAYVRRVIIACFVTWILGVGGTWWWTTTSVERLSLPLSGVRDLVVDLDNRLGIDIHLELLESSPGSSDGAQGSRSRSDALVRKQRWAESINRSSGGPRPGAAKNTAWDVVVAQPKQAADAREVLSAKETQNRPSRSTTTLVIDTRPCSEPRGPDDGLECTNGKAGRPYLRERIASKPGQARDALVVPFPEGRLDGSSEALRAIADILASLDALVPPPSPLGSADGLFALPARAIPSSNRSGNVTLSFVLLNEDASMAVGDGEADAISGPGSVVDWEIDRALDAFLEPHLSPLRALHDFRIESQVLHHAPLKFKPAKDEAGKRWIVLDDQMKRFVNQEQWSLDSASSNDPVLRFLLFLPSPTHSPMILQSGEVPAFTIPQYGGVSILSGAPAGRLLAQDLETPFASHFAQQLQLLLGVPPLPTVVVGDEESALEPPTAWQIAHLQRIRTRDNLRDAKETLLQIGELVSRTKEMRVGKEVQRDVTEAVDALRLIAREPSLDRAYHLSATAARLANRAYFNPTLVGSLYFPDEHKYAVYTPLFAPVAVPLVVAVAKEVGLWLKRRRSRRAKSRDQRATPRG